MGGIVYVRCFFCRRPGPAGRGAASFAGLPGRAAAAGTAAGHLHQPAAAPAGGAGRAEGTALLADAQTAGRGRLGRQFYSPEGTGLYLSLLLRPAALPLDRAVHITTMAAVAVCRAIEELGGGPAQIKWVNDVFLHGRKVCGI